MVAPGLRVHPEHHEENNEKPDNSVSRKMGRCCKKFCKCMLRSTETLIGVAIFGASAIALVLAGLLELPKERPPCAEQPRAEPVAWVDEPVKRMAVVWCEYGANSAVFICFLGYCCCMLGFAMLLRNAKKYNAEDRRTKFKKKAQNDRRMSSKRTSMRTSTKSSAGTASIGSGASAMPNDSYAIEGFQVKQMIPKEAVPEPVFEDMDGRIFDV